ncbi:MAG TPA: tocopherol cyclase family protein, partial [Clostridiaceae bacterium]|nr:tocopherol cyclase family protein [Clostridiaceae bacterium]
QYIHVRYDEAGRKTVMTGYVRYPVEAFRYQDEPFRLKVGESIFTENRVIVHLSDGDMRIDADFRLGSLLPLQTSVVAPTIMGPFTYIPKMECIHGIVSMDHSVDGRLSVSGEETVFTDGRGYIEKDWGSSFPKRYIWIQCNNFRTKGTSVFFSVADIPFMGLTFPGFICNLVVPGKEYRFATYTGSPFKIDEISHERIVLRVENHDAKLILRAYLEEAGELIAPHKGKMQKTIKEGLSGKVDIYLYDKKTGKVIEDTGIMAGIENVGF